MPDKRIIDLLTEVSEFVGGLGGGAVAERPGHVLQVVAVFDRCRSMLGAIRLLLAHNFVHEAVLLGRPLFTDSLSLAELAAVDDKRRASLVFGWYRAGLADLEGLLRERQSRGDDVAEMLDKLASSRERLETYARERGIETRHWRPDDQAKSLADKHGHGDEYIAMRVTDHFVHGSSMAVSQRYSQGADETVVVGGPGADLETLAGDAARFAAHSALHAARAVCRILGWAEPPELEALLARIDELGEDES